jgi:hypothetical protein
MNKCAIYILMAATLLGWQTAVAQVGNEWYDRTLTDQPFLTFEHWIELPYDIQTAYLTGMFDTLVASNPKYKTCRAKPQMKPTQWTAMIHAQKGADHPPTNVLTELRQYLDIVCPTLR